MRPALTVWLAWLALMAGANLATPLYPVYARQFHFSSLVLTAIFATYAVVLVPSLILFGRLSDRIGRRRVILLGLAVAIGGLALFAAARSDAWLFGARSLQGLAVGMISGAATAALVELDPDGDRRRAALLAGLAQAGGSALGPLLAGVLAQWAPAPRQLSYVLVLAVTLLAAASVARLQEGEGVEREPWRIQWPRVPRRVRADFSRVSLTAAVVWATVALFLSIVPLYAAEILKTRNLALLAAIAAVALVASSGAQIAIRRLPAVARRDQAIGLLLLGAGLVALVAASPLGSLPLLLAGAVGAGIGHGLAFVNAQQELNELAPADRRGEVTSAFIAAIYALVASSVVATGALDRWLSLSLSVDIVAGVLVLLALAAAAWQLVYGAVITGMVAAFNVTVSSPAKIPRRKP
jgi:predicted MFS family arabinose efflux permease